MGGSEARTFRASSGGDVFKARTASVWNGGLSSRAIQTSLGTIPSLARKQQDLYAANGIERNLQTNAITYIVFKR